MVKSTIGYSEMRGMQAKHMRSMIFFQQKYKVRCTQWLMFVWPDAGSSLLTGTVSEFSQQL